MSNSDSETIVIDGVESDTNESEPGEYDIDEDYATGYLGLHVNNPSESDEESDSVSLKELDLELTRGAVISLRISQILTEFDKWMNNFSQNNDKNIVDLLASVHFHLAMASKRHTNLLKQLPDKKLTDINEIIKAQTKHIDEKYANICKINDEIHELEKNVAVQTAKIESRQQLMECTVCYSQEKNTVLVPCGHTFCKPCVERLFRGNRKCAMCRLDIMSWNPVLLTD